MKIYAGIGSRSTPADVLPVMTNIASHLAKTGWVLRSGHADGADMAFEAGANFKEIFLPWPGFNGADGSEKGFCVPFVTEEMARIAEAFHPAWHRCSSAARKMHIRNVCQILGTDCHSPADMVICWTPGGRGEGGTGQAIRIAKGHSIPVFDIALPIDQTRLCAFLEQREAA